MRKVEDVIRNFPVHPVPELSKPNFNYNDDGPKLMAAVSSMRNHMTDEGWQLQLAFMENGYKLVGNNFDNNSSNGTDVLWLLNYHNPSVLMFQDKREWMGMTASKIDRIEERFINCHNLKNVNNVFKCTVIKDAHSLQVFNRDFCREINCHAWITYYNTKIVKHLSPFIREEHLIRTYHSVDVNKIPEYSNKNRSGTVISGALSRHYPFRRFLTNNRSKIGIIWLKHPGYKNNITKTDKYLQDLSRYKVSICTTSIYGFALRKIIESVACGCVCVTDLPEDDKLPFIDNALVRVPSTMSTNEYRHLFRHLELTYDSERALYFAKIACEEYDYRKLGFKIVNDIDNMRINYE